MGNSFVTAMETANAMSLTENGMTCANTTKDELVDLFGTLGALRNRTEDEIISKFVAAFAEDKLLAVKMAFYARDIRNGGLGERRTARIIWKYLANNYPEIMRKNLGYISTFGRWDDLYVLLDTPCEEDMWHLIISVWHNDIVGMSYGQPISLMAKWLPSVNASSSKTIELGKRTAKVLNLSYGEYRKMLSKKRAYLKVVEVMMSARNWDNIAYGAVPSKAMNTYRNAFKNHSPEKFNSYLKNVAAGKDKINSATLFPYDIVEKYLFENGWFRETRSADTVLEEQWKALPNYINSNDNVLVMADTSGSMMGRPMATALGLAIYFAEHTHGAFHNYFLSFSERPNFIKLKGDTLWQKLKNVDSIDWDHSTNIQAAFDLVLNAAISDKVPAEDMPKAIVIISDMEFDSCTDIAGSTNWSFYKIMKERFATAGYTIPNIVFWNVNSRHDTYHAFSDWEGVQLMSGQSASTFKAMLENLGRTPYEAMCAILNSDTYSMITI